MNRIKVYKKIMVIFAILLFLFAALYAVMHIDPIGKYLDYHGKIRNNLPDTFRIELPLLIDRGHFYIHGQINHQQDMTFGIDTKSTISLVKSDDLEKLKATYWGTLHKSSTNVYGQKRNTHLYFFDSFEIQSISFGKVLFNEVAPTDYLYDILDNNVLGENILDMLFWKFSIDDEKMILFSNTDIALLKKETEGYTKIESGARDKIKLSFPPVQASFKLYLDLGYNGEIEIDKKIFTQLAKQFSYKKVLAVQPNTTNDTIYVFDGLDIQWNEITVPDCQVIHRHKVNLTLIGARFMRRFNFVLAYNAHEKNSNHSIFNTNDLYIQPVNNFDSIKRMSYISNFGFAIGILNKELLITNIEIGGLAEISGLKIRDKVLNIDNGVFDLSMENRRERFNAYVSDKKQVDVKIERDGQIMDFLLTKNQ
ncbi:hypothetical protein AGMMS49965_12900 [Bacteroidia bacterium]|nr:hypothetical protein AGMMS49965_12900 [Bacteroidia bacterium]